MSRVLTPSRLHRLFGVPFGAAPRWLVFAARESLLTSVCAAVLLLLLAVVSLTLQWSPAVMLVALVPAAFVDRAEREFVPAERLARARRRRRECLRCGEGLTDEDELVCRGCDGILPRVHQ